MDHALVDLLKKIESQKPFGLIRPSDGEYLILTQNHVKGIDGWTFEGGILKEDIQKALQEVKDIDELYVGLPCNTCSVPWNCHQKICDQYSTFQFRKDQITQANLFMCKNYKTWAEFLSTFRFVLVGPYQEECPNVIDRRIIPETLVNEWPSVRNSATQRVLDFVQQFRGQTILFAAGPLSKIWIPLCLKQWPYNQQIDAGSSISHLFGKTVRSYMNPNDNSSMTLCKHNLARLEKKTNLVYFCIFFNQKQLDLFERLLQSLVFFSDEEPNYDIGVLCDESLVSKVDLLSSRYNVRIQAIPKSCKSIMEAACARLKFFEVEEWKSYQKVLYADTDMLVQKSLNAYFEIETDKVASCSEGSIQQSWFGGIFFDEEMKKRNLPGVNSGLLLFNNSERVKDLFCKILQHIYEQSVLQKRPDPNCMDQPFISYHLYTNGMTDFSLNGLTQVTTHRVPLFHKNHHLIHFAFPLGRADYKMNRMNTHFSQMLENNEQIFDQFGDDPTGRSQSWNSGRITFEPNHVLKTTWAMGKWYPCGKFFICEWQYQFHMVRVEEHCIQTLRTHAPNSANPVLYDFDFMRGLRLHDEL